MNTDEKAIREAIGRWHDRAAAGDVEGVLELIAEDAIFLTPGHPPIQGRAGFETGLRKVLATHRIESSGNVREVVVLGDLAYCVTDLTVRMTAQPGLRSVRLRHVDLSTAAGWDVATVARRESVVFLAG